MSTSCCDTCLQALAKQQHVYKRKRIFKLHVCKMRCTRNIYKSRDTLATCLQDVTRRQLVYKLRHTRSMSSIWDKSSICPLAMKRHQHIYELQHITNIFTSWNTSSTCRRKTRLHQQHVYKLKHTQQYVCKLWYRHLVVKNTTKTLCWRINQIMFSNQ